MINADFNNGEEAIPASMLKSLIVENLKEGDTFIDVGAYIEY